jgi:hypothetical protein
MRGLSGSDAVRLIRLQHTSETSSVNPWTSQFVISEQAALSTLKWGASGPFYMPLAVLETIVSVSALQNQQLSRPSKTSPPILRRPERLLGGIIYPVAWAVI